MAGASTPARWAASSKVHVRARPDRRSLLAAAAREQSTDCGSRSHGESRVPGGAWARVGLRRTGSLDHSRWVREEEGSGSLGPARTRTDFFVRGGPFARACAPGVCARGREPRRTRGARSASPAGPLWGCNTVKKAWLHTLRLQTCAEHSRKTYGRNIFDLGINQGCF